MSKNFKILLKILVSITFLLTIFYKLDFKNIFFILSNIDIKFIILVLCVGFLNNILCGWRWWYLNTKIYNIEIPFFLTVKLYFVGGFFNLFLPTSIGGDVFKARYVYKYTGRDLSSVNSIIIDRFTGLFVLVAFSYVGLVIAFLNEINLPKNILHSLVLIFFLGIGCMTLLAFEYKFKFLKKIPKYHAFEKLLSDLKKLSVNKKYFLFSTLITILFQFLVVLNSYFVSLSLNLDIPFVYFLIIVPIVGLLTMIPISFSGSGIREASYLTFFSFLSLPSERIVLIPVILFLTLIVLGGIGGIFFLKEDFKV